MLAAFALLASVFLYAGTARAQELLTNRSFESPVAPANGNNFYTTIPGWSVTATTGSAEPVNVIRPWSGYTGNPASTPSGGGSQYFDINSSAGTIRQSVTIPTAGMVDFSAWFSVRDEQQALTGLTINIRDASNTVVATASTSFTANNAIGLWKQASAVNVPIAEGTYTFELVLPDPANVDLASLVFKPALTVSKSSTAYSDPINGTSNPKMIPGAVAQYTIAVANPATYTVTGNSIAIIDATPANSALVVTNIGGGGSGPAAFVQGSPSSALSYSFSSLASSGDNIDFSNNGGASWTYRPSANANGVDPAVTHVRLRPQGTMAAGSSFSFRLRYRVNG